MNNENNASQEILIRIQPTPNPNALKFILGVPVLNEGKESFSTPEECYGNPLPLSLLQVESVKHIHFFGNVITVTHMFDADVEKLKGDVCSVIQSRIGVHNPNMNKRESKKAARENLSPELQAIEEILDRTIRPGLQGDGGDIEVIKYEDNKLYVSYQGACGTCPSSTSGTLMAIEGIIRDEFNPHIEVIPL